MPISSDIAVIICIYTMDRWVDIKEAIASVHVQTLKAREIILVVDHNDALLKRAQSTFTDITVIPNTSIRGLSGARNVGVAESTSGLVAFLDDDAIADPEWLLHLANACQADNVLGATGPVHPIWKGQRPTWFPEEFMWTVGCSFRGSPTVMSPTRNLSGGSMVIKRDVLLRAGVFNPSLGRDGSNLISCEETEFCIRAKAAFPSSEFIWTPNALIGHKVPASRLTWTYLTKRCHAEGLSKAVLAQLAGPRALGTEQDYVLRILTTGVLKGLTEATFRLRPSGILRAAAIVLGLGSATYGYMRGKLRDPQRLPAMPQSALS
jgi:glucosyl-dolichyl phosphate glucuronosyltransferase